MNALGSPAAALQLVTAAMEREACQARERVAQVYHSLGILARWSGRLAWALRQEGRPALATAVSLLATTAAQQAAIAQKAGWPGAPTLEDWDPDAEFQCPDPVEAADALVEELLTLAQMLQDAAGLLLEEAQHTVLRTAGRLLTASAQLQEAILESTSKKETL